MPPTMRALGLGLALALSVTACSGDEGGPDSAPSTTPQPPPRSSTTAASDAECTVAGFVPGHRVTLQRKRPIAAYAHVYRLAAGTGSSGETMLGAFDLTPVRVTAKGGEVPPAIERAVLGAVGARWPAAGLPEEDGPHAYRVDNDSDEDHQYIVYRGADTLTGSWSAQLCGAPDNDGTRVDRLAGRFATVSRLRPVRTYVCGSGPTDAYERAASRVCRA